MPKRPRTSRPAAPAPPPQPVTVTVVPTVRCEVCHDQMVPALLTEHYLRAHPAVVELAMAASQ